jgi:hypothetical protein
MMTPHFYRLVALTSLVATACSPLAAQMTSQFDAGAVAGGSALGPQPRVGMSGLLVSPAFGAWRGSMSGSLSRFASETISPYELAAGAKLFSSHPRSGWWLGADVVRRNGFRDIIEQPLIETGGWRRIGGLVFGISASRRSASFSGMTYFKRSVGIAQAYFDTVTGQWDTVRTTREVHDSARIAAARRWAETEASVAWQGRLASASVAVGARPGNRYVPRGAWTAANLIVRLGAPLSLVVGAGTTTHGGFVLDAEHRYVSLGFRVAPRFGSSPTNVPSPVLSTGAIRAFDVADAGNGQYRLSLVAPNARRVEVSGDFTRWKPVSLGRSENGRWILTVPLVTGTHRLNARVDGGDWIVPPGLTTMSDDFAGEVGVLVIERKRDTESK